jgi:hypothetical protein
MVWCERKISGVSRRRTLPSSSVRGGASNTVDNIKATSGTNDACPQASHLAKPIVLDFKEIKATDNQRLNDVKGFTEPSYERGC